VTESKHDSVLLNLALAAKRRHSSHSDVAKRRHGDVAKRRQSDVAKRRHGNVI